MPVIKEYTNPVEGLRPDETGVDAFNQAARRAGGFFSQQAQAVETVGNQAARGYSSAIEDAGRVAVDYEDHQQIMHGAAAMAAFTEQKTKAWDDTINGHTDPDGTVHPPADPNDPTLASKFMAQMEPELDKLRSSFWTEKSQAWAESHIDSLRTHFNTQTMADTGRLAASAISVDYKQVQNSLSNTAMMNPSAVDDLIKQAQSSIGALVDSSPNLRGVAGATARTQLTEATIEQIVKAGAIGAIRKANDPETEAQKWGEKYPKYINGAELKQLAGEAKTQNSLRMVDYERSRRLQKEARDDQSKAVQNDYIKSVYSDNPQQQNGVTARGVQNDDRLTQADKDHIIMIQKREMKPETEARISQETFSNLSQRIRLPDGDPNKITDLNEIFAARSKAPGEPGGLSRADATELQQQFKDMQTPDGNKLGIQTKEFLDSMKARIDKSNPILGSKDASGMANFYRFQQDLETSMANARKNNIDPRSYITSGNANFMGQEKTIQPYLIPFSDAIENMTKKFQQGQQNLTGPGKTITGVTVQDVPAPLRAIPNLMYNRKTGESFDPATGSFYDKDGQPKKK